MSLIGAWRGDVAERHKRRYMLSRPEDANKLHELINALEAADTSPQRRGGLRPTLAGLCSWMGVTSHP